MVARRSGSPAAGRGAPTGSRPRARAGCPAARQTARVRVLVAPDSFGGTLSAAEAAAAVRDGWLRSAPGDTVDLVPLSDGGPGFLEVLHAALGGELVVTTVEGPLARPVPATVLVVGDVAYVESAQACGLHLLAPAERRPGTTTTYGVGQLVAVALGTGVRRVVVGLGGSGTNDGGAGALAALGLDRLDAAGGRLPPGGTALREVDRLVGVPDPRLAGVELLLASDVDNPLLGLTGASAVFGPQKGAGREEVALLDAALARWAGVVVRDLDLPPGLVAEAGAGAAGGLGFGLLALGGRRVPGIATVLDLVGLADRLAAVDLVVTGEGSFDWQSLRGKVVSGVAGAALEQAVPCVVLAGQVSVGRREQAAAGVEAAYAVTEVAGSVAAATARPAETLAELAARVARTWSRSR